VGEWQDPARTVLLRGERARAVLGAEISDEEIEDILTRLRFGVARDGSAMQVAVPSSRATKDITIEEDLIEEVGRVFRYGNLPEEAMTARVLPPPHDERRVFVRKIQDRLSGGGRFHEVLGYSFLDDSVIERLGLAEASYVRVVNPVVETQSRIRRDVLPSILEKITLNRRHREDVRLFEVGKGYRPEGGSDRGEPCEVHQLAIAWAGVAPEGKAPFNAPRFHQLHGALDDLFRALGLTPPCWGDELEAPSWAHPARRIGAFWGTGTEPAAILADLEPGIARSFGLEGELASDVAVAQVSIDALLEAPRAGSGYQPIPRYPGVKVDVAIALGADTPSARVVTAIEKAGKGAVAEVELFDVYQGESLGAGRKSLAYHVLLQSDQKTLTDKDATKFFTRLERNLEGLGAELRKG